MSEIRIVEVLQLLRAIGENGVKTTKLRRYLVDSLSGVGERFEKLILFLESIELLTLKNDRVLSMIDSKTVTKEQIIFRIFSSKKYASEFTSSCKSVKLISNKHKLVRINFSRVSIEFLWFVLLLKQLGVFIEEHKPIYRLNSEWFDRFMDFLSLSTSHIDSENFISPCQYEKNIQRNLEIGFTAEQFVVKYERARLANHPLVDKIVHVAVENAAAGFDILSFDSEEDLSLNRKIEVKSWSEKKEFYFSANEFSVATTAKQSYFLYLVNRKKMNNSGYSPEVIQNPTEKIFQDEDGWKIEPDGWKIEQKGGYLN